MSLRIIFFINQSLINVWYNVLNILPFKKSKKLLTSNIFKIEFSFIVFIRSDLEVKPSYYQEKKKLKDGHIETSLNRILNIVLKCHNKNTKTLCYDKILQNHKKTNKNASNII